MTFWQRNVLHLCPCFSSSGPPFGNPCGTEERRKWREGVGFLRSGGWRPTPPKKRDRRAASVYHAQVNCDGNVSSNEAETGKGGDVRVRTSVVGMWEKAGNWKVLSCLYFEGTFKGRK